ncbi:MAG TPA: arginine--tRNA ligase [Candidatus Paceibacterota bacterium]|nr:arginine--tRNA ligase [Verrucomicrobiota bacterium]HSA10725.1 arginine--tRNA ligase [Candidatus Paceibacterota bacterium]
MLPCKLIEQRLQQAVHTLLPDADLATVLVRPCPDPKFGDYQTNALMSLAKARRMNPRQLASDVLPKLQVGDICESVDVAGAGFLNFRLKPAALAQPLEAAARGEPLFFQPASQPRTIVVDFSSPNVAKAMHVGHIRSTILGDALARTLRLLGHKVVTDNHLGDWGTQFGMLLAGWKRGLNAAALKADPISEMERLYKQAAAECKDHPAALDEARRELVKLQQGDEENLRIWREMIALSRAQFDAIYERLGVRFDHTLGESFYHPRLQPLVQELRDKGIARQSEGALAVFFDDIPQLKEHPALIQKSDGAFNYTTTDLATLAYRLETWHPDEVVYVTDARQQLHFQQLFAAFRRWHPEARTKLAHVWFGSILGDDGKPFKTRSGETVKLTNLLDEAQERALTAVSAKNPALPEAERREIARVVGLGALKYADLLPNRQGDYVFSWDKLLALNGNTAPYLQYAYARIRSIFRKGNVEQSASPGPLLLSAPEELALARHMLNFGLVLEAVADDYRPNFLCNYLYELAGHFTAFYENCPVLKSEAEQRTSRLVLCDLTGRVLKQGLEVLGIETLEQM